MGLQLEIATMSCPSIIMPNDKYLLLRSYHGEHGPKVPITGPGVARFAAGAAKTGVYVNPIMHLISNGWLIKAK
jgi:hypothetical protein